MERALVPISNKSWLVEPSISLFLKQRQLLVAGRAQARTEIPD